MSDIIVIKHTCEKLIWNGQRWLSSNHSPCGITAKVQHEGKWYCGIHNPIRLAEKEEHRKVASNAKWNATKLKFSTEQARIHFCDGLELEFMQHNRAVDLLKR